MALEGHRSPGPQGPQGIQRLVRVEASDSVAPEQVKTVVANCPAGMLAVSGGYSYTADGSVVANYPVATGWWLSINTEGRAFGRSVTAVVLCSPNIPPVSRPPSILPARCGPSGDASGGALTGPAPIRRLPPGNDGGDALECVHYLAASSASAAGLDTTIEALYKASEETSNGTV